ncbi:hypothetical protein [Halobacillus sp. A5]|uniref:hypothetical protein n=1 Tax=Halobacillus sp. A5 TaxID=2880263 RepID=UPI0020A6AB95|nr:hypothetical protein [Halobacillus sp. A5]MCP3027251.1 hypothetical protein [Halobacillus sp. A5]
MNSFLHRIKEQINTEDETVFRVILYSISDYPHVPDKMMAELLRQSRKSDARQTSVLANTEKVTLGDESIRELLKCLQVSNHYNRFIEQIKLEKLFEYRQQLEPYIHEEDWAFLERIRNADHRDELNTVYTDLLNEMADNPSPSLLAKGKRVVDRLVEKEWLTAEESFEKVKESVNAPDMNVNGLFHVYAFRYFREDRYVPMLAELLTSNNDLLLEEAADTLNHFQTDIVADELYPLCFEEDFIYPIGVLGETKTDYALSTLRRLYEDIDELEPRELIAESMCLHFSEESIPEVESFMEKGEFTGMVDMDETAYTYFKVMNREHPDLMLWKNEAEEREGYFRFNE